MSEKSIGDLAEERAAAYAPLPKYRAPQAGAFGVMATLAVVILFGALTGVNAETAYWPTLILAALGFLLPYSYVRSIEKKHFDAFAKEYGTLSEKP